MTSKSLDLPPAVARTFVKDMRAFFAEEDRHKRDEIAARQLSALNQYRGRQETPLRISDIKMMFTEMEGIVG
jgi:hypothetical protein